MVSSMAGMLPGFGLTEEEWAVESRLIQGATVQQIADEVGKSYVETLAMIRRWRDELPPKRGRLRSDATDRRIMELLQTTDLSQREIARRVGCSQHAVHCRYRRIKSRSRREVDSVGEFRPVEVTRRTRCPVHGTVTVWPCVACAARDARGE